MGASGQTASESQTQISTQMQRTLSPDNYKTVEPKTYSGARSELARDGSAVSEDRNQVQNQVNQQMLQLKQALNAKYNLFNKLQDREEPAAPRSMAGRRAASIRNRILSQKIARDEAVSREAYLKNRVNQLSEQIGYYNTFNYDGSNTATNGQNYIADISKMRADLERMNQQFILLQKELEIKEFNLQQHVMTVDNLQQILQQQQQKEANQEEEYQLLNDQFSQQQEILANIKLTKAQRDLEYATLNDEFTKIKAENVALRHQFDSVSEQIKEKDKQIAQLQEQVTKYTKKAKQRKMQLQQYQRLNITLQNRIRAGPSAPARAQERNAQKSRQHVQDCATPITNDANPVAEPVVVTVQQQQAAEAAPQSEQPSQVAQEETMQVGILKQYQEDATPPVAQPPLEHQQSAEGNDDQTPEQLRMVQPQRSPGQEYTDHVYNQAAGEDIEESSDTSLPNNVSRESREPHTAGLSDIVLRTLEASRVHGDDKDVQADNNAREAEFVEERHGMQKLREREQMLGSLQSNIQNMFGTQPELITTEPIHLDKAVIDVISKIEGGPGDAHTGEQAEQPQLNDAGYQVMINQLRLDQVFHGQNLEEIISKVSSGETLDQHLTDEQVSSLKALGYDVKVDK